MRGILPHLKKHWLVYKALQRHEGQNSDYQATPTRPLLSLDQDAASALKGVLDILDLGMEQRNWDLIAVARKQLADNPSRQ